MTLDYNPQFPGIDDLREGARKRIPRFAFEYLDGGCNEDVNLHRNTHLRCAIWNIADRPPRIDVASHSRNPCHRGDEA